MAGGLDQGDAIVSFSLLDPDSLELLVRRCRVKLGDPKLLRTPTGYPKSLALCVIDSIQSTGVRYASVENVIGRYRAYRAGEGADGNLDSLYPLRKSFIHLGGPEQWARVIGNGHHTSRKLGAPLKAEAISRAAEALTDVGISTADQLRSWSPTHVKIEEARHLWTQVEGQASGVTWRYLLMLAGAPGVKPDRMIRRFVGDALGVPPLAIALTSCVLLVGDAAIKLDISPTVLDHAIWSWQRRQPSLV